MADCGDGGGEDEGGAKAGEEAEGKEEVPEFLDGGVSNAEGLGKGGAEGLGGGIARQAHTS